MVIDTFIAFEENYKTFEVEIDDFFYWHYIRKSVYDEVLNKTLDVGKSHNSHSDKSYTYRFFLKMKQIPKWIFKNPFIGLKEKEILVLNHARRVKNGKSYDCVYTDLLLKNTELSYYVFEHPELETHYTPVTTQNLKYLDYLNFKVSIHIGIIKLLKKNILKKDDQEEFLFLLSELEKIFDIKLNKDKLLNKLTISYLSYKPLKKYYNKILEKIKPKVVIEVVSYVRDRMVMNEIAKEKNIPVIEFQHGTMGKNHIAYNFTRKKNLKSFPDYIFTFGDFWKSTTRFPIDDENIKVVGWPYFEQKLLDSNVLNKIPSQKKKLLFISQGTIGGVLSKLAIEAFKKLGAENYEFIYKLHPGEYSQWEEKYPWLKDSKVKVVDNNEFDMHHYFMNADVQIGVYSTALYEGLGYQLKTIIFAAYGYEYMEDLISKNIATLVKSSDELVAAIEDKDLQSNIDNNTFWKKNALQNMNESIDEIIKDH